MKKGTRLISLLLALVFVFSMLTGCATTKTEGDKPGDNQSANNNDSSSNTAKKDTLTVALTGEPPSLTTCDHDSLIAVYMNILTYNGLMRVDHETLDILPDLAESYSVENETDWTFKLKQGVKFHNGDEMTAEDVVASIEWAKSFAASASYTANIKSIEAVDTYEVKIVTEGAYAGLLADLAYHFNFIVPKSLIEANNDFNANPVGTGPYVFKEWNYGDSLKFVANENYFDADRKASIPNLMFKIIPEGTSRTIALEAGEIDFIYELSTADVSRLQDNKKFEVKEVASVENFFLALNTDVAPFDDVNVRQAINYGINREDVIAAALNGYATPNYTQIASGYWGSTDEGAAEFNLEKAQEYLDKWGGNPSDIVVPIICSNETKVAAATVMQSSLAKLGIKVEVVTMDTATYFASWTSGDWTALISSWSPSNALTYVQRYHSSRAKSYPGAIKNDEVDALVKKAESTIDEDARLKLIHEIVAKINELSPQPSLYQPSMFRAYDANLGGVVASATGYVGFNDMFWK
ncbi:MAG TPA: ABC transporter substrate-binding protein [Clostridiales bacterium]|nr:ABC transporter substrate-binding protein [Clostridiales bacterium]